VSELDDDGIEIEAGLPPIVLYSYLVPTPRCACRVLYHRAYMAKRRLVLCVLRWVWQIRTRRMTAARTTATVSPRRATTAAPTSELSSISLGLSSTLYLSDPVDPFGCLRYACGLLAESRCLLPRAPRPPVPRTRPASDSFEAVHTGTGDLLSPCDLVASMQTHRSPSRQGR